MNRYIGANGEPINLAETTGHARLELTKIRKYNQPIDISNIQMDKTSADGKNDCAINKPGEKVTAHIQQQNLEDNAYVSELFVGNPPQKIRALFDTGSTNTWILNKATDIGGKEKEFSYDNAASSTSKKQEQKAHITFGSGSLAGHFYTDDVRVGSCDSEKSSGQIHIKNQKFGNVEA